MKNTLTQTAITFTFFALLALVGYHEAAKRCHDPAQHDHVCAVPERAGVQTVKTVEQLYDGGDHVGTVTSFDYGLPDGFTVDTSHWVREYNERIVAGMKRENVAHGTEYKIQDDDGRTYDYVYRDDALQARGDNVGQTLFSINAWAAIMAIGLFLIYIIIFVDAAAAIALTLTATTLTAQTPTWHDDTGRGMHMMLEKACAGHDTATAHVLRKLNESVIAGMRSTGAVDGTEYTITDAHGRMHEYVYRVAEPDWRCRDTVACITIDTICLPLCHPSGY